MLAFICVGNCFLQSLLEEFRQSLNYSLNRVNMILKTILLRLNESQHDMSESSRV